MLRRPSGEGSRFGEGEEGVAGATVGDEVILVRVQGSGPPAAGLTLILEEPPNGVPDRWMIALEPGFHQDVGSEPGLVTIA